MTYAKIKIEGLEISTTIEAQYNPATLQLNRSAGIERDNQADENSPKLNFTGGQPFDLSMELLFDTTEDGSAPTVTAGENVHAKFIDPLLTLMKIGDNAFKDDDGGEVMRPPYCKVTIGTANLTWNGSETIMSRCYIKSVDVNYTMFTANAVPLRAKATVNFVEVANETSSQNPTTLTEARRTWLVRPNETIDWIAYQEYGDTAMWRTIAEANGLDNPMQLQVGQLLRIVPLE